MISSATRDEQARQRLVEMAREAAAYPGHILGNARSVRSRAGFRDPLKGSWCAAGLTAAMADAGLLVPSPGTPARRGAVALLDFVARGTQSEMPNAIRVHQWLADAQPGDIIAWLQHPPPDPAGWRRGHVAVIVATDSESITTVGWNEGAAPGRVMLRRLWRDVRVSDISRTSAELPASHTVPWRRPGGLYGIARPVAA